MSWSIGEISRMFDIPVSTLRYYNTEGLFPDIQRKSGIRIFTETEIERLRMIECLKKSGLEIREIRQFMDLVAKGDKTLQQRHDLMQRQLSAIDQKIEEMQKVRAMIKFKCWYYDESLKDGSTGRVEAMLPDGLPEDIQKLYDLAHKQ